MGVFSYSKNYLQLTCSLSTFSLRQELIHVLMDTHSVLACAQGLRRKSERGGPCPHRAHVQQRREPRKPPVEAQDLGATGI